MRLSIIIPTRRLTDQLAVRIEAHRQLFPDAEIIVVEPADLPLADDLSPADDLSSDHGLRVAASSAGALDGLDQPDQIRKPDLTDRLDQPAGQGIGGGSSISTDRDVDATVTSGIQRLRAPRGRGTQCNAGAARATGPLLLFLHDDTALPVEAPDVVSNAFADPRTQIACFRLRFDHAHWLLSTYAFCSRFDSSLTSFGDQGILIRRSFFAAIGGFPDWPLFEDVDLLSRARLRTRRRIKKLPAVVTTSAVRFLENGLLRQQLLNAELMLRFSLGASPEALRRRYETRRG